MFYSDDGGSYFGFSLSIDFVALVSFGLTWQTKITVCEAREEDGLVDGDVLIFPEMIKYRYETGFVWKFCCVDLAFVVVLCVIARVRFYWVAYELNLALRPCLETQLNCALMTIISYFNFFY